MSLISLLRLKAQITINFEAARLRAPVGPFESSFVTDASTNLSVAEDLLSKDEA
jgi:hypothetical protein